MSKSYISSHPKRLQGRYWECKKKSLIYFSLYPILKSYCGVLFVLDCIIIIFCRFKASFLAVNHSLIWERTVFHIVQKSPKFLLEIMTLMQSANIMGFDKLVIVGGRSFMCIIKSKVPRIDLWGTSCFTVPQFEKKF
jgi:hypothetical protein